MSETNPTPAQERPEITHSPVTAFAIGLAAGVGSALLGIGGGLVMVPAMTWLLRLRQHRAVGTSLAVILPTALAAAYLYHAESLRRQDPGLQLWVVLWLALGGVVGGVIGAMAANAIGARQLRRIFGVFVIATGVVMVLRALGPLSTGMETTIDAIRALELVGVGVLVGIVAGLLGVGGGLVMVPALSLLLGYTQHLAQGTSLAVIIPVSLSAMAAHTRRGNVVWSLVPPMAVGAVIGALITTGPVFQIEGRVLRIMFGVFLVLVGISMAASRPARQENA